MFKFSKCERLIVVARTGFNLALNFVREPLFTLYLVRFGVKLRVLVGLHGSELEISVFVVFEGACGLLLEVCSLVLV